MSTETTTPHNAYLSYFFLSFVILDFLLSRFLQIRGLYIFELFFLLILLVYYVQNAKFRYSFTLFPIFIWGVWCIYSLTNWYFKGILNPEANIYYNISYIIIPFFVMVITYFESVRNINKTLVVLLLAFSVYTIVGILFQDKGSATGTGWNARGGQILGNHLPLNASILAFLAYLSYLKKIISTKVLYLLILLTLAGIFLASTRKAFGSWLIISFFFVIANFNISKPKNIFYLIIIGIIAYYSLNYIADNTLMGSRMSEIQMVGMKYTEHKNSVLNMLGDRAFFYILGWEVFLKNPLTGIGLTNFPIYTDTVYVLHTEYMVQLCEGGIIGSVLFILFVLSLLFSVIQASKKKSRKIIIMCIGGIVSILFIGITAWTYSSTRYFIVYGVVLACCNPLNIKSNKLYRQSVIWELKRKLSRISTTRIGK